jgi:CheY-like chemotaxis protein
MRILYVDLTPDSIPGRTDEVLRSRGHTLFYVSTCSDALKMIRNQCFDSLVITQYSLEVLDFIATAHTIRGELPLFVTDDWSVAELPSALEWCGGLQQAVDSIHIHG